MPAGGSSVFTDVIGYEAGLRNMVELLVERPREFHARLTWMDLPRLRLIRASEASARVAYVALPANSVLLSFATDRASTLICDGDELRFGDMLLHGRGDRLHQRTSGPTRWGAIQLAPRTLVAFGMAMTGQPLSLPSIRRVLQPLPADRRALLRLHAQVGRMAETAPVRVGHKEVVRALEQDLMPALVNCLTAGAVHGRRQSRNALVKFETMLVAKCQPLRTDEISSALGMSSRYLRTISMKVLGMSPSRYQRLRRLKLAGAELLQAEGETASIVEILQRHGFADVGRFVAEYVSAYGEMPPMPATDR
jgi:AraC-like DNA-binding protein